MQPYRKFRFSYNIDENLNDFNQLSITGSIVGNAGVGKTCILKRFTLEKYDETTEPTIGTEAFYQTINYKGS